MDVRITEFGSTLEERNLDLGEQILHSLGKTSLLDEGFALPARSVAASEGDRPLLHILGPDLHADGDAAHFPIVELEARRLLSFVHLDPHDLCQLLAQLLDHRHFTEEEFAMYHPGANLGKRLLLKVEELMARGKAVPAVKKSASLHDVILEMTSKRLGVDITELGPLAMKGMGARVPMNSYCFVFGTQSLVNALAAGSTREDVAAAACHSVAEQVFEQQLQEVDIKEPVIMVGGTSLIEGLVFAMGELLQTKIVVPPYSQYIGAVGSALLASGFIQER